MLPPWRDPVGLSQLSLCPSFSLVVRACFEVRYLSGEDVGRVFSRGLCFASPAVRAVSQGCRATGPPPVSLPLGAWAIKRREPDRLMMGFGIAGQDFAHPKVIFVLLKTILARHWRVAFRLDPKRGLILDQPKPVWATLGLSLSLTIARPRPHPGNWRRRDIGRRPLIGSQASEIAIRPSANFPLAQRLSLSSSATHQHPSFTTDPSPRRGGGDITHHPVILSSLSIDFSSSHHTRLNGDGKRRRRGGGGRRARRQDHSPPEISRHQPETGTQPSLHCQDRHPPPNPSLTTTALFHIDL